MLSGDVAVAAARRSIDVDMEMKHTVKDAAVIVPERDRLDTLMIILSDRLSELIAKGEVVRRYYNPGNLFRTVHIVLCNDDRPDPTLVQPMVGDARLVIHAFPAGLRMFMLTLGWRPFLLRLWARPIVRLARQIAPQLIRCHVANINAFVASEIKRRLGIPYALSLHINADADVYHREKSDGNWRWRVLGWAIACAETTAVQEADLVMPVYSPILPYLQRRGVSRYEIVYNAVGQAAQPKSNYAIDRRRVNAICVGRQLASGKDPSPILEAMADIPELHLTLIGSGDLHDVLRAKAVSLGVHGRTTFLRALPNEQVLARMAQSDIFVYCSQYHELSKSCIEAALTGLPLVINDRDGDPAEEMIGSHFCLVPGTRQGFHAALRTLIDDDGVRERLGRAARAHALTHWNPHRMETRVVEIYRRLVRGAG